MATYWCSHRQWVHIALDGAPLLQALINPRRRLYTLQHQHRATRVSLVYAAQTQTTLAIPCSNARSCDTVLRRLLHSDTTPHPKSRFQDILYQDLTNLVNHSEVDKTKFIIKDYPAGGAEGQKLIYRIFTYGKNPRYSDFFCRPNALNCRGTMFLVDTVSNQAQLIALPMHKFFNYGEGEGGQKYKISDALQAFMKEDGSLITSYICPFQQTVKFKSKSVPTYLNYGVVERSISEQLKGELTKLTSSDVSVDLELTTPENLIMIEYTDYTVHVLKARSTITGEYIDLRCSKFATEYPTIAGHLVKEIPVSEVDIKRKDIEGYVLDMPDGRMVKLKTLPYLSMVSAFQSLVDNHMRDKTKIAEYLYKAAIDEVLNRVRSCYQLWAAQRQQDDFPHAQLLAEQLTKVEAFASETLNDTIQTTEAFYQENKHLQRADYAKKIVANPKYAPFLSVMMNKYLGREVNYKELAVKMYANKAPVDTIVESITCLTC